MIILIQQRSFKLLTQKPSAVKLLPDDSSSYVRCTLVRNFLFLLPIIVTLGALSWALLAYQQISPQSPSHDFFTLWQQGFGNTVIMTPAATGIVDTVLLLIASILTARLGLAINMARRVAMSTVARVNEVLSQYLREHRSDTVAPVGDNPERWARAVSVTLTKVSDTIAHSASDMGTALRQFSAETTAFLQQAQDTNKSFVTKELQGLTTSLRQSVDQLGAQASQTQNNVNQLASGAESFAQSSTQFTITAQDLAETLKRLENILTRQGSGEPPTGVGASLGSSGYAIDRLQFTSFSPGRPVVSQPQKMLVYAYIADALATVREDAATFGAQLGTDVQELTEPSERMLVRGTSLTIVPECDGVTFDPEYDSFTWYRRWHRLEFTFTARAELAGSKRTCTITVYAGPLIIAVLEVPFDFQAAGSAQRSGLTDEAHAAQYRRIFLSYSHQDTPVVLACRAAYHSLSDIVLIDRDTLRSGELFDEGLEAMIRDAEIFQLFWSARSARSCWVRREWEYALGLNRGPGFVRPVYWAKPMEPPPDPLSRLHFAFVRLPELYDPDEPPRAPNRTPRRWSITNWFRQRAS